MSRSLGIDLGDKRVGIALSDNSNIIASVPSLNKNKWNQPYQLIQRMIFTA